MDITRLQHLFHLYYNKTATAEEKAELMLLVNKASPQQLAAMIMEEGQGLSILDLEISPVKAEQMLQTILKPQPTVFHIPKMGTVTTSPPTIIKQPRFKYAAAAAVIFMLGLAAWFLTLKKEPASRQVAQAAQTVDDIKAPSGNSAKITLGNGKTIYLDSVRTGTIATQGAVAVTKLADGQIIYANSATASEAPIGFNTLSNPAASNSIHMTLIDGSRVWLNAASSLTYPVAFSGSDRRVSITGEAYFEVAPNRAKPFKVAFNETEVEVLGTHFNINAYEDEPVSTTTLLEGAIKISDGRQAKYLSPGHQALVSTGNVQLLTQADTAAAVAWKNNYFQFSSVGIEALMRQTSRWYNVEVAYKGAIPTDRFSGKISRTVNLSQFLKVLQYSEVHFKLEGRKLTVLP